MVQFFTQLRGEYRGSAILSFRDRKKGCTIQLEDGGEEARRRQLREIARKRARQAAIDVWARAGRLDARLRPEEYARLFSVLREYVIAGFGRVLDDERCAKVVEIALAGFLPPLYIRHVRFSDPQEIGPDELIDNLGDIALAELGHTEQDQPPIDCGGQESDEDLVSNIFGHGADAYQTSIREVRLDGGLLEYLVVTHYMDRRHVRGEPPAYAEVVSDLDGYGLTVNDVERILFNFANRIAAQPR